jgi:hypothetical protein
MATGTTSLTELDAINAMLGGIFEAPVNSITESGVEDVAIAKRVLSNRVRAVLVKGTANNIEEGVTLLPDALTGRVPLPTNVLRVDNDRTESLNVVQRGTYLYDRTNHTFTFTRPVVVAIYYHLEWEELPEHIKYPVMVLAARQFQAEALGSADKGSFSATDEAEARDILGEADADIEDSNMTTDNWSVASMLQR